MTTRVTVLRAAYGALALAFVLLAGATYAGGLAIPAIAVALLAALLLAFSGDELPKWAGVTLLGFFVLVAIAFLFATSITVRTGARYHIESPSPTLAAQLLSYLVPLTPLAIAVAALVSGWERERLPRLLLIAALAGIVLAGILSYALVPASGTPTEVALAKATGYAHIVEAVFALSALTAATGSAWAAARPE